MWRAPSENISVIFETDWFQGVFIIVIRDAHKAPYLIEQAFVANNGRTLFIKFRFVERVQKNPFAL
jgi:hypothetical protein